LRSTDPATAALGSHFTASLVLPVEIQHVMRKEKNGGALSFHSSQRDCKSKFTRPFKKLPQFLNIEGLFLEQRALTSIHNNFITL